MKNLRIYLIIVATILSISAKSQIQVDSVGRVGIGPTNPNATLDVSGLVHLLNDATTPLSAGQGTYFQWNNLTQSTGETDIINNQGGGSGGFAFYNLSNTTTSVNGITPLMFLTGSGNVGIGNTNPQYTLDVTGQINSSGGTNAGYSFWDRTNPSLNWSLYSTGGTASIWNNGIGNILNISQTGNLGIGITNPTHNLDVAGTVHLNPGWSGFTIDWNSGGEQEIFPDNNNYGLIGNSQNQFNHLYSTSIDCNALYNYSDSSLKEDIKSLPAILPKLLRVISHTYNFKKEFYKNTNENEIKNYTRTRFGYIGQELINVFPELVHKSDTGLLSINYIDMIPIITKAIQELNTKSTIDSIQYTNSIAQLQNHIHTLTTQTTSDSVAMQKLIKQLESDSLIIAQLNSNINTIYSQITSLTSQLNQCCAKTTTTATTSSDQIPKGTDLKSTQSIIQSDVASLAQNTPNPFSQNTTIGYYLPSNVVNAVIYIYNLQGAQLNSITIFDRGNGSIIISGNSFTAGMYIYSLITDGTLIDTKKMILTN
jgi:hypothetical protein